MVSSFLKYGSISEFNTGNLLKDDIVTEYYYNERIINKNSS